MEDGQQKKVQKVKEKYALGVMIRSQMRDPTKVCDYEFFRFKGA